MSVEDRKISNEELSIKGLVVNGVEIIPPTKIETLSHLRNKRKIPYVKLFGKIWYQQSELIKWVESKKVSIV